MKMRSVVVWGLLLLFLPASRAALPRSVPTERDPSYTRWLAWVAPGAQFIPNTGSGPGVGTTAYSALSQAVDSRENAHVVEIFRGIGSDGQTHATLLYQNTIYQNRLSNGFSSPLTLSDLVIANTSSPYGPSSPDIAVDHADALHIAWSFYDPTSGNTFLDYERRDTSNWTGVLQLNPSTPVYVRSGMTVQTYSYNFPKVLVSPDGHVHVLAQCQVLYTTGSDFDSYLVHAVIGGTFELVPGTITNPAAGTTGLGIDYVTYAIDSTNHLNVFYREQRSGTPRHFTIVGQTGSWGTKTQFGYDTPAITPDMAIDSVGNVHYVWDASNVLYYRIGAGTVGTITTTAATNVAPHVVVDSRDQIHVVWTSTTGLSYAARIRNPDPATVNAAFKFEYQANMPTTNNISIVRKAVISANEVIHVASGAYYTRTMDYTVGVRDTAAMAQAFQSGTMYVSRGIINTTSGNFLFSLPLFYTRAHGPAQSVTLVHNSADQAGGFAGPGWKTSYEIYLIDHWTGITQPNYDGGTPPPDTITLVMADDRPVTFHYSSIYHYHVADTEYGYFSKLQRLSFTTLTPQYLVTTKHGETLLFDSTGRFQTLTDMNGNMLKLTYNASGQLTTITDLLGNNGSGRASNITYETQSNPLYAPRIATIQDPAGGAYTFGYTGNHLGTVTFSSLTPQPIWTFQYSTTNNSSTMEHINQIKMIQPPRGTSGNYGWTLQYLPDSRIAHVQDPAESYLLDTDGDGSAPQVRVATFSVSLDETQPVTGPRVATVTDRRGFQTIVKSDAQRSLATEIDDPAYLASTPGITPVVRTFDTYGNLTDIQDRWGFHTSMTYDTTNATPPHVKNNLLSVFRPHASGTSQDQVAALTYTTDGLNHPLTHTSYATPTGGSGPLPRTTTFDYNSRGQMTDMIEPDAVRPDNTTQVAPDTHCDYNGPRFQLTRMVNPEGQGTNFSSWCPGCDLAQAVRPDGQGDANTTTCDIMGFTTSVQTPNPTGACTVQKAVMTLDLHQQTTAIKDAANQTTSYSYDPDGNITQITPPAGLPTTFTFDKRGVLTSGTTPDGNWSAAVDASGDSRRLTNARGFTSNASLDFMGRPTETRIPGASTVTGGGGGPAIHTTDFAYDQFDGTNHYMTATKMGSPNRVTKSQFDNRGRPSVMTAPDGTTQAQKFYDEQNNLVAHQLVQGSALQSARILYRDSHDRVTQVTNQDAPYGGTATNQATTYFLYNRNGSIVQTVDPLGNPTQAGYAHKVTYVRDIKDRVIQVIDGKGVVVRSNIYNDGDFLSTVQVPDPVSKSAALVNAVSYLYTARAELRSVSDGSGVQQWSATFGTLPGQIATTADALNNQTYYTYDTNTQCLTTATYYSGGGQTPTNTETYGWTNGLLTSLQLWNPATQAFNASYGWSYDQANRLEKFTSPSFVNEQYFYDSFGELIQQVAGTKTITHTYNSLGQATQSAWTGAYNATLTRTFNGSGLLATISDGTREKDITYDLWKGTPNGETFKVGGTTWKTQSHQTDVAGNQIGLTDSENKQHTWLVDENNRVTQIQYLGTAVHDFSYTPGGLLSTETYRDSSGNAMATTTYTYNSNGLLVRAQTVKTSTGESVADFKWQYDNGHQVTDVRVEHIDLEFALSYDRKQIYTEVSAGNGGGLGAPPPFTNSYGAAGTGNISTRPQGQATANAKLSVPAWNATYLYDALGNMKSKAVNGATTTYAYTAGSQVQTETIGSNGVNHSYDTWGNETTRTLIVNGNPTTSSTFGYSYLNVLSTFTNSANGANYQYDCWPTGERYAKTNLSNSQKELYVPRLGQDVATEYTQVGSGSINLENTYAQGSGTDSKTTRVPASGSRAHYVGDQVGSVELTLDDTASQGSIVARSQWGVAMAGTTSERFGFAQRELDSESGLLYMRGRMYDPNLGRFTQRDPIGFQGGVNLYGYCSNNPVSLRDPLGHDGGGIFEDFLWWLSSSSVGRNLNALGNAAVNKAKAAVTDFVSFIVDPSQYEEDLGQVPDEMVDRWERIYNLHQEGGHSAPTAFALTVANATLDVSGGTNAVEAGTGIDLESLPWTGITDPTLDLDARWDRALTAGLKGAAFIPAVAGGFRSLRGFVSGIRARGSCLRTPFPKTAAEMPRGKLTLGRKLLPAERAFVEELLAQGNDVEALAEGTEKSADFKINGGEPAELKTLISSGETTLKNALQKAATQGKLIIIDARGTTLTMDGAMGQILRAEGNVGGLQGRVWVLTKEGNVIY